ncbi:MAG: DUF1669 domain-containing protein, partial [Epsilonproteobacteria bacterium]|nr:DUF1669 domain-containing protein [Campylobacterota bacterium]
MRYLLLLSIFLFQLLAQELYFMPYESREAKKQLLEWIDKAKSQIDVAIYSFTNHEIAQRLRNAARRGVKVRVIADEKQMKFERRYSKIPYLAKYRNIDIYLIKGKRAKNREYYGKMHLKLAIIDSKRLVFGSANWTYSAFKRNYELIYFLEDYA